MQTLETEAISRGCRQITLTTFSFQAPDFYQQLGYHAFGIFGNGHQKSIYKNELNNTQRGHER
jgi:hypothetical protein